METDRFLEETGVSNRDEAMRNSLRAAVQHNPVYSTRSLSDHKTVRREWASLIRKAAEAYGHPVSDADHCATIKGISDDLSRSVGQHLRGGKLTFGTSQKALNLYLKFVWRLGDIGPPPHCPVDGTVLRKLRLPGAWTKCDSQEEYMAWITAARRAANSRTLAEWEYALWSRQGRLTMRCS